MTPYQKLWNGMNFRSKMIISYFVIALIPLLLFSVVIGSVLVSDARQTAYLHTSQVVNQVSESLDVYIASVEKLIDYVIVAQSHTENQAEPQNATEAMLEDLLRASSEIAGIMIAYDDDSCVGSGMSRTSRDLFADEQWYHLAKQRSGSLGIISTAVGRNVVTNVNYSADTIFSLVKSFPATPQHKGGVVLFDIRHDSIEQLISRVSIGEDGFLYVVDEGDAIVYAPLNPIVLRIDDQSITEQANTDTTVEIQGMLYSVSNVQSSYTGWRCIGVLPNTEFSNSSKRIVSVLICTILSSILLVTFVALRTASSVIKPISELRGLMSVVEKGDFSVRYQGDCNDEIGMLGNNFNHMLEKIDELIQQLYIEKQSKLEAQLKNLQEQIKPHFLYNTLDTISWMARDHEAMDVVEVVDALTNMFRIGLSKGKDEISLREEKTHVANYLYIQKIRYQDKLRYEIDIPECYDTLIVPKLILQPLVENAIYHGIKLKRGGGVIRIVGRQTGSIFELCVCDNGAGIAPTRLQLLQEQLQTPGNVQNKVGFGLFYVAERIKLCYGAEYGVNIDSVEGVETTVTIHLPLKTPHGGELRCMK